MSVGWLQRRPVLATVLTGLGVAMLALGLFGLFAPAATLDRLWAMSNTRLWFMLLVVLVGAMALTMISAALVELARRSDAPKSDGETGGEAAHEPTHHDRGA